METASKLLNTYGGGLSLDLLMEALYYNEARNDQDMSIVTAIAAGYDSSNDYWKLIKTEDGEWDWLDDDSMDFDISLLLNEGGFNAKLSESSFASRSAFISVLINSLTRDGKSFGTISALRMNEAIASALGYMTMSDAKVGINIMWPNEVVSMLNGQGVESIDRSAFIAKTLDLIAYNAAHTTIVYDSSGRPVTLHKIDAQNRIKDELPKQNDSAFNGLPNLKSYGCNFMDIIAVPQLLTKHTLSNQEIINIWNKAINENIMKNDGTVLKREKLADLAMATLGINNINIQFGGNFPLFSKLVGYRVKVPYGTGGHFVLNDPKLNLVYNPGTTYTADREEWLGRLGVVVYGK
jgi:hypothetical protein